MSRLIHLQKSLEEAGLNKRLMKDLLLCIKKMEAPKGLVVKKGNQWFYENPPVRIISDHERAITWEWLREVHAYFSTLLRESRSHHTGGGGFALNQLMRAQYHNERGETCCGFVRVVKLCREIVDAMGLEPFDIRENRFVVPSKY